MKVIYNKYIPFKGFYAVTILRWIFVREEYRKYDGTITYKWMLNHEEIHLRQERELLYIFFYLIYLLEYLFNLIRYKGDTQVAYAMISFEREAYAHEREPRYLRSRRPYSMWRK